jgi:hypothetical protein
MYFSNIYFSLRSWECPAYRINFITSVASIRLLSLSSIAYLSLPILHYCSEHVAHYQTCSYVLLDFFLMALPAHSGPRPLFQFRNQFSHTVGLPGRVISPSQGRYLQTEQHKHKINAYTHQTSMPWVVFESTIPVSERALDRFESHRKFHLQQQCTLQLVWGHGILLVCTVYSVLHSEIVLSRKPFGMGHMYIYTFLLRMTNTTSITSQNIDVSSWGTLYITLLEEDSPAWSLIS